MKAISRRSFLKRTAAAGAGVVAAPCIVPASALGADGAASAGDRIAVGIVGNGIMGDRLRKLFHSLPGSTVVAVCDVNPEQRAKVAAQMPGVALDADFRDLLARPGIDAVAIATPHHTHGVIAVAAARAGKHIYCEKPLTHTIRESRAVLDAVRAGGKVLQVGTHRRAHHVNRLGAELVRNGRVGKLRSIRLGLRPGLTRNARPTDPALPVPDGFAWDLWLGPAPWSEFCGVHAKRLWNKYSDYSTGEITLTDCHIVDGLLWAAGPFLRGPVEVEGGFDPAPDVEYRARFTWADGVTLACEGSAAQPLSPGVTFEGTEGSVHIDWLRFQLRTQPETMAATEFGPDAVRLPAVPWESNEWLACCKDFLRAIRDGRPPLCPVEDGHRMTVLSDLIWIAPRLGRKATWDDAKEQFVGDDEANRLLHYDYREPWKL